MSGLSQKLKTMNLAAIVGASVIMLAATPTAAHACACCDTYRVTGVEDWDVLNVRAGPSVRYAIVGQLEPGTCGLDVVKDGGSWLQIQLGNVRGWVNARFIEFR